MPKYSYPPLKEGDEKMEVAVSSPDERGQFPDRWEREQNIPVNKAIIDSLQVGDEVVVTLRGRVRGLRNDDNENVSRQYLELETNSVDAYPDDYESEEDFQSGYNEGD